MHSATGVPAGRDAAQVAASDSISVTQAITQPAPGEVLLIAREDDALCGFVHVKTVLDYFSQRSIAHIADIVVADSAEGRGIGKALMALPRVGLAIRATLSFNCTSLSAIPARWPQRTDLNAARTSLVNSAGSSHAAKCPPRST